MVHAGKESYARCETTNDKCLEATDSGVISTADMKVDKNDWKEMEL